MTRRGFAMPLAILAVAVLLFAAIVLLQYASNSGINAGSVATKQAAMDAAEAGLNDGIRALDASLGTLATTTKGVGTLSTGASYTWTVEANNIASGSTPSTYNGVSVPSGTAYISSTASLSGERSETVGALVGRTQGAQLPDGAIKAAANIIDGSHAPVLKSTTGALANVYANGNITVGGNPGTVQGSTYAGGSTNQWVQSNNHYTQQPPMTFPSTQEDTALETTALGLAKTGTIIQGSSPTGTYSGNAYVNGSVNLSNGTMQFNGGGTIYINGNVSISGQGQLVNENGSLIVINGTFATSGTKVAGYTSAAEGGQLMVLAPDPNPSNCAAGGGGCAVTISGGSATVGLIFVPNGSIQMSGNGTITGAIAAGSDIVFSGGGSSGAFQYDASAGTGPINATNYQALSYIEQ